MKKFIDSILKNKKSLNQRFDEKEMELINAESPKNFDDLRNTTNNPLEKNSLYFFVLFSFFYLSLNKLRVIFLHLQISNK